MTNVKLASGTLGLPGGLVGTNECSAKFADGKSEIAKPRRKRRWFPREEGEGDPFQLSMNAVYADFFSCSSHRPNRCLWTASPPPAGITARERCRA